MRVSLTEGGYDLWFIRCLRFVETKLQQMCVSNSLKQTSEDVRSGLNKLHKEADRCEAGGGDCGSWTDRQQVEKQHLQMRNREVEAAAWTSHYCSQWDRTKIYVLWSPRKLFKSYLSDKLSHYHRDCSTSAQTQCGNMVCVAPSSGFKDISLNRLPVVKFVTGD